MMTVNLMAQAVSLDNVLTMRQQHIIEIAAYTGKGDLENLKPALAAGLDGGLTVNEICEVLVHAYAYCGFPRSLRALQTFIAVLDERKAQGIEDTIGRDASPIKDKRSRYERGRDVLAEISGVPADMPKARYAELAPVIERFLKEHLFADLFERDVLTYAERELTTVSVLAANGRRGAYAAFTHGYLPKSWYHTRAIRTNAGHRKTRNRKPFCWKPDSPQRTRQLCHRRNGAEMSRYV